MMCDNDIRGQIIGESSGDDDGYDKGMEGARKRHNE